MSYLIFYGHYYDEAYIYDYGWDTAAGPFDTINDALAVLQDYADEPSELDWFHVVSTKTWEKVYDYQRGPDDELSDWPRSES